MQTSTYFQRGEVNFLPGADYDIGVFHGHPELVNFPSTSEVFHAVFENTFYANFIGNGQGKTLEANEKACGIFGYTQEEMAGLTTQCLFDTNEKKYVEYLALRNSCGRSKAVITGIRKNGDHFPCLVTSMIFFDDNGEKRTLNTTQDLSKNYSQILFE